MELLNLYAEIQANPRNLNAYRYLIKYYKQHGMDNEAEAFAILVEEKTKNGSNNIHPNKEQSTHN